MNTYPICIVFTRRYLSNILLLLLSRGLIISESIDLSNDPSILQLVLAVLFRHEPNSFHGYDTEKRSDDKNISYPLSFPRVPDRAHPRHFMPRNSGPFCHGPCCTIISVAICYHCVAFRRRWEKCKDMSDRCSNGRARKAYKNITLWVFYLDLSRRRKPHVFFPTASLILCSFVPSGYTAMTI